MPAFDRLRALAHRNTRSGRENIRLCFSHLGISRPFEASYSAMIHPKTVRGGPMNTCGPDPLQDALELRAHVRGLKALLEFQRWQIEVLNDKLYASDSGGAAARRLLALKQSEVEAERLRKAPDP
jgi:hypothetical protein